MYDPTILRDICETFFCVANSSSKRSDESVVRFRVDKHTAAHCADMLPTTNLISGLVVYRRAYLKKPLTFLNGDMCVDLPPLERAATKHAITTSSGQVRISEMKPGTGSLETFLHISDDSIVASPDVVAVPSQTIWLDKFVSETTVYENLWAERNPDYCATIVFDEPTRRRISAANKLISQNTRDGISLHMDESKVYLVQEAKWGSGRYLLSSSRVIVDQRVTPLTTQTFRDIFTTRKPSKVEIYSTAIEMPVPGKARGYGLYRKSNYTFMRFFIETLVADYEFCCLPQCK